MITSPAEISRREQTRPPPDRGRSGSLSRSAPSSVSCGLRSSHRYPAGVRPWGDERMRLIIMMIVPAYQATMYIFVACLALDFRLLFSSWQISFSSILCLFVDWDFSLLSSQDGDTAVCSRLFGLSLSGWWWHSWEQEMLICRSFVCTWQGRRQGGGGGQPRHSLLLSLSTPQHTQQHHYNTELYIIQQWQFSSEILERTLNLWTPARAVSYSHSIVIMLSVIVYIAFESQWKGWPTKIFQKFSIRLSCDFVTFQKGFF